MRLGGVAMDAQDAQSRVATFLEDTDLQASAAYRLLDTVSELGEVAKEICTSTGYGEDPEAVAVPEDVQTSLATSPSSETVSSRR